ncbi:MAG TPA: single-stranded DNA-binding protein [Dehalococcoidia bacterium]|jgi:single-strand DNA-binding protein|nr:single-stranded DNA-binding protein [Dehalococcoidia bacterium]
MAGLNKVMIIGNLGADPEMRYTADGNALTSFRVAASRNYNGPDGERREETEWFSVVTWRKLAEQCSQYLQKGRRVYVEGRLRTRSWDTPEGQRRYKTEVVAERVLFLDRAGAAPFGEENQEQHEPILDIEPEDIPFE